LDDGVILSSQPSEHRKRSTRGEHKERPRLSHFSGTNYVDLANLGHRYLRLHVAVKDAFPKSTIKNQVAYRVLSDAVKNLNDEDMNQKLKMLDKDSYNKAKVLEYVSSELVFLLQCWLFLISFF
jgi:hypothetical protein